MGGKTQSGNQGTHEVVTRHWLRHSLFVDHLKEGKQFSAEMIAELEDACKQSMIFAQRNPITTYEHGLAHDVLTRTIAVAAAALEKNLLSSEGRKKLVRAFIAHNDDQMAEIWGNNSAYAQSLRESIHQFIIKPTKREIPQSVSEENTPYVPHN